MKKTCLFIVITAFMAYACNDQSTNTREDKRDSLTAGTPVKPAIRLQDSACYMRVLQRDSHFIKLYVKDSMVTGFMEYRNYQKDKSHGPVNGIIRDSIIHVTYSFASEGMNSVNDIFLKIRDDKIYQGFADAHDSEGRPVYNKSINRIRFDSLPFTKTDCNRFTIRK